MGPMLAASVPSSMLVGRTGHLLGSSTLLGALGVSKGLRGGTPGSGQAGVGTHRPVGVGAARAMGMAGQVEGAKLSSDIEVATDLETESVSLLYDAAQGGACLLRTVERSPPS